MKINAPKKNASTVARNIRIDTKLEEISIKNRRTYAQFTQAKINEDNILKEIKKTNENLSNIENNIKTSRKDIAENPMLN